MVEDTKNMVEGAGKGIWGSLIDNFRKIFSKKHLRIENPGKTLVFHIDTRQTFWSMGKSRDEKTRKYKPAMSIKFDGEVTNITKNLNIKITGAILKKTKTYGVVFVRHPNREIYSDYMIEKGSTIPVSMHFWVREPFRKDGQVFTSDIIIYDQFNNKHVIRKVKFSYKKIAKGVKINKNPHHTH